MLGCAAALAAGVGAETFGQMAGVLWRAGAMLAVVWLAYDQVQRLPAWLLLVLPLLLLVVALKPRWLLWAIPVVVLLVLLRPRGTSRSKRQ
ncbi:MAG: hypothetical protein ACOY3P_12920 [Planctomycetota bacterium]